MDKIIKNFKYKNFLLALINGDRINGSKIINEYLEKKISIKELYEKLIKESLYKVGELWEYNKISVATEHLATAITESILNSLFERIVSQEKIGKTAIVACAENEFHQVGIKMIADIFEMNGWNTFFLGANVPTNELIEYSKKNNPDVFALSLSIYFHLPILEKMIQEISRAFPEKKILVGGQAFSRGGLDAIQQYKNVKYLKNLNSVELFIKNL